MDNDLDDFDNLVDEDLLEELTEMFPEGHVVMHDGSALCLCGRDPASDTVMMQIAKAAALIAEFDLCLKGCVKDAAAAYDHIHRGLKTAEATQLCNSMLAARKTIAGHFHEQNDVHRPIITHGQLPH